MNLDFRLLIVDDAPENIESAVGLLEDHLATLGFALQKDIARQLTENALRDLA